MPTTADDEIDFGKWGRRLGAAIKHPFVLWRSHRFGTGLAVVAGVLLACAIRYSSPSRYRGSFIIRPNDRTERFHLKMLSDIARLVQVRDVPAVMRELSLDEDAARALTSLEVHPSVYSRADSVNSTDIQVETTDYNQLQHYQAAIIQYLEEQPYFKKIAGVQKEQIKSGMELAQSDLARLDRLKQLQLSAYGQGAAPVTILPLKELLHPTDVYAMSESRHTRMTHLMAQLSYTDNFQLVKGCVVSAVPVFPPRLLYLLAVCVPAALLLALPLLHYRRRRRWPPL